MNLSIGSPPDWRGHRELWPRLDPLPGWLDYTITWPKGLEVPPVFLGQFAIPSGEDRSGPRDMYVFGFRLDLDKSDFSDDTYGGFFVEYAVVEFPSEKTHWLSQRMDNTTYSSLYEKKDCMWAYEIKRVDELSLGSRPRWKKSEAEWATFQGNPMRFVGQIDLPENNVTRKFFTWDKSTFLFWQPSATGSVYKITTQNISAQTAEEHYAKEQEEFDKL